MCLIVVLHRTHPDYPVVVAANRDETYARPTSGPRRLADPAARVSGVDEHKGGLWMGATEAGFLVAITNQRTLSPPDPRRESRGQVALAVLRAGSPAAAGELLAGLEPGRYNAFNLLFGDAGGLRVAYARPEEARVAFEDVPPGAHALPNDRLDSPDFPKVARARALAAGLAGLPWRELVPALRALLADHERPPLEDIPEPPPGSWLPRAFLREVQALCIHTPGYGTRTATLAALEPGRLAHYLVSAGPPCTADLAAV